MAEISLADLLKAASVLSASILSDQRPADQTKLALSAKQIYDAMAEQFESKHDPSVAAATMK